MINKKNIIILFIFTIISVFKAGISLAASGQSAPVDQSSASINGVNHTTNSDNMRQEVKLTVSDAWARASVSPNKNSAVYMKINNPTKDDYIIIGASSINAANNVELHKSFTDEKGVSRMTSLDKLVIPAGSQVNLEEGGIHIMLMDLKNNLEVGQKISIDLKIDGKDPITVEAEVK